jgi:DNA-binding CsgD family transcriptional regulator
LKRTIPLFTLESRLFHEVRPFRSRCANAAQGKLHSRQGDGVSHANGSGESPERREADANAARSGHLIQDDNEESIMIAMAAHRRQTMPLHQEPEAAIVALAGQPATLALDYLGHAVFILDANSRIQFASAAARQLIETDRLCVQNGSLCSRFASETTTLRRLVRERVEAAAFGRTPMTFQRLDAADDALCLGITATRPPGGTVQDKPLAIVFAASPTQISLPGLRQLRDHFGLTDAQARLAIEVVKGSGLKACARRLRIAETTARSHLRQIFEKTGTQRQAELVRLVCACRFSMQAPCEA